MIKNMEYTEQGAENEQTKLSERAGQTAGRD